MAVTISEAGGSASLETIAASLADSGLRVDTTTFAGETLLGKAVPGASNAAAVWKIRRFDAGGNDSWAGGNANYDKVWNDRATLTYS
jgi:hypothetical protein